VSLRTPSWRSLSNSNLASRSQPARPRTEIMKSSLTSPDLSGCLYQRRPLNAFSLLNLSPSPRPSRIPKTAKPNSKVSQLLPSIFFYLPELNAVVVVTQPAKLKPVPSYTSYPIDGEITDHAAEAAKRERRRKLLELTKAAFPDGKVPMPYHIVPAARNDPRLPFVHCDFTIRRRWYSRRRSLFCDGVVSCVPKSGNKPRKALLRSRFRASYG
jgi:hypothetical protein